MSSQPIALRSFDGVQPAVIHGPPAASDVAAAIAVAEAERAAAEAERDEIEARLRQESHDHAMLVQRLAKLEIGLSRGGAAAIAALSAAIGDSAKALLPALAEAGFAEELAVVTTDLLRRGAIVEVCLRVSPPQHERVVAALEACEPAFPVAIVDDSTLLPGEAELVWHRGGASFDTKRLVQNALERLDRHTQRLLRKTSDE